MLIRKTTADDLDALRDLFAQGRAFMVKSGNSVQWKDGHPLREMVESDIAQDKSYVCVENDRIIGSFVLQFGDDPTYAMIQGEWKNNLPYATMHRVVSDGTYPRLFDEMVRWSFDKLNNLRADTHELNWPMQKALLRNGFVYCGIIHVADGTPRLAYQKTEP